MRLHSHQLSENASCLEKELFQHIPAPLSHKHKHDGRALARYRPCVTTTSCADMTVMLFTLAG